VRYDVVVVGGGIVGLATAYQLTRRRPGLRLLVLEKEPRLAAHQSGHDSNVVHSGLYYPPGSRKARYAVEGARRTVEFCRAHGLPVQVTGKVVVATSAGEVPRLDRLYERGLVNGVRVSRLGPAGSASTSRTPAGSPGCTCGTPPSATSRPSPRRTRGWRRGPARRSTPARRSPG
jgi:L-2-hydroxyglutarate oxidase